MSLGHGIKLRDSRRIDLLLESSTMGIMSGLRDVATKDLKKFSVKRSVMPLGLKRKPELIKGEQKQASNMIFEQGFLSEFRASGTELLTQVGLRLSWQVTELNT